MKKLNNKGLSIVEFIVVFVMLMILTTGMMNIIIKLKDNNNEKELTRELLTYKNSITKLINDDLIYNNFKKIICETQTNAMQSCNLYFQKEGENETFKTLIYDPKNYTITYDSIKYKMPKQDFIVPSLSPVIEIDKNYLIIKLPIHEVGKTDENDKDYGINIVYPVGISS